MPNRNNNTWTWAFATFGAVVIRVLALAVIGVRLLVTPLNGQTQSKTPLGDSRGNSTPSLPFEDARRMTVLVAIKGQFDSLGSAVWIGKAGYLATCYHVVKDFQGRPLVVGEPRGPAAFASGGLHIAISGDVTVIDATIAAFDESTDVAILHASEAPGQTRAALVTGGGVGKITGVTETFWTSKGATLAAERPKLGQTLLLAGFPINERTLILQTGIATGLDVIHQQSFPSEAPPENGLRIILSLVSNPGNSGGPVLDQDGNVVGLLEGNLQAPMRDKDGKQILTCFRAKLNSSGTAMRDASGNPIPEYTACLENSGISVAVPAQFIADLAKKKNIDLQ